MRFKPVIDRWVMVGNSLVGYIFDHSSFAAGERIQTDAVIEYDPLSRDVRCLDGDYRLGEPGTAEEHRRPIGFKLVGIG